MNCQNDKAYTFGQVVLSFRIYKIYLPDASHKLSRINKRISVLDESYSLCLNLFRTNASY